MKMPVLKFSKRLLAGLLGIAFCTTLSWADLQNAHETLSEHFRDAESRYATHIQTLWMAHLEVSPTIVLALNKLDEKTGGRAKDKRKSSWRAGFLRSLLQVGAYGSAAALGNASPLIGASVLGNATAPDQLQAHLESVTSADMVQLVKQIEDEQASLLTQYIQFRQALDAETMAKQQLEGTQRLGLSLPQTDATQLSQYFALSQMMAHRLEDAEHTVQDKRTALILSTNPEAVALVEKELLAEKEAPAGLTPPAE